jgi:hypothetical protein
MNYDQLLSLCSITASAVDTQVLKYHSPILQMTNSQFLPLQAVYVTPEKKKES